MSGLGLGLTMFVLFSSWALALWYGGQLVLNEVNFHDINLCCRDTPVVLYLLFSFLYLWVLFHWVNKGYLNLVIKGQASPAIQKLSEAQGAAATLFDTISRKPVIDATKDVGEL